MKAKTSSRGISIALFLLLILALMCVPNLCLGSVESSLNGVREQLTNVILPVVSVIGLALAALSFFTGNPQAKQHIIYAILGCCFGFGAQAIVDLISRTVR